MSDRQLDRTVLMVSYCFPPHARASSIRAAQIARILAARQWRVLVLSAEPDPDEARDFVWLQELEQLGIECYTAPASRTRLPSLGRHGRAAIRLARMLRQPFHTAPDYFHDWIDSASRVAERIIREHTVNLILGLAPPISAARAADVIARRWSIPLAIDLGEAIELIPHRAPSYDGRNHHDHIEALLRSALYATVPTRGEKEHLLRRYEFLTHEELGILPFEQAEPRAPAHHGPVQSLVVVAEELDTALVRPLLGVVRANQHYHVRIAAETQPSLAKLIHKWRISDRVTIEHGITPQLLDEWFAGQTALVAYATSMRTVPSAVVYRAAQFGVPIVAVGEYASSLVASGVAQQLRVVSTNATKAIAEAIAQLPPRQVLPPPERDDSLEREFSRRLGMVMKL
jgi:hypothetical protein